MFDISLLIGLIITAISALALLILGIAILIRPARACYWAGRFWGLAYIPINHFMKYFNPELDLSSKPKDTQPSTQVILLARLLGVWVILSGLFCVFGFVCLLISI